MQNVILYTRVSTDEQADRGFSLRDQEARLRAYCDRSGLRVVAHYQDDHSAKTFDRPAWQQLMKRLDGDVATDGISVVDTVLVVKWDRFSRNATDAFSMIRQLDESYGVRVQAIDQPVDRIDDVPEQLLMLGFYVTAPEVENRRRSIATKHGMRRAMQEGRYVYVPPKGYMRGRDGDDRYIIVPGPDAHFVRHAFELVATTRGSINAIREKLVAEGFSCSKNRFPVLLRNRLYQGDIVIPAWRGEAEQIVEGIHEPLVSRQVFAKVQERFAPVVPAYRKLIPELPLRGHLLDPSTLHTKPVTLTGSASRSRHGYRVWYYHGTGKGCFRVQAKVVHAAFDELLESVRLSPEVTALARAVAKEMLGTEKVQRAQQLRRARERFEQAADKLLRVDESYFEGDLERDSYQRLKKKYSNDRDAARLVIEVAKQDQSSTARRLDFAVGLLSRLPEVWAAQPIEVRSALVGSIWPSGLYFDGKQCRTPCKSELLALFSGKISDNTERQPLRRGWRSGRVPRVGLEPTLL
ncbi:MAG: hypothetical protein RhofKO_29290 [Rhodothermales bacterium]